MGELLRRVLPKGSGVSDGRTKLDRSVYKFVGKRGMFPWPKMQLIAQHPAPRH